MSSTTPAVLITGSARRIGAHLAEALHAQGYNLIIHYSTSKQEALALSEKLNSIRSNSSSAITADLNDMEEVAQLASQALSAFGRLDVLINNASSFYPTPIGTGSPDDWDTLFGSNAKAPFFLSQALAPALKEARGSIINIADIHADKPLKNHTIYCMAKAANVMLTKSMAKELAPEVRVNGIAPGAILWPEQDAELSPDQQTAILDRIPLAHTGKPEHIAATVQFLIQTGNYMTGQILAVDGGRSLSQ